MPIRNKNDAQPRYKKHIATLGVVLLSTPDADPTLAPLLENDGSDGISYVGASVTTGTSADLTAATGGSAAGTSGDVNIQSGDDSSTGTSGNVTVESGTAAVGTTGNVALASGDDSGAGTSGNARVESGSAVVGVTGDVTVQSGDDSGAGATGDVTVESGTAVAGTTGTVRVQSGDDAGTGTSGNVELSTGDAAVGVTGDIALETGTDSGAGVSGDITMTIGGTAAGTEGTIQSIGRHTTTDGVPAGTARVTGGRAFPLSAADAADSGAIIQAAGGQVAFNKTHSIPADTIKAGTILHIRAVVRITTVLNGAATMDCALRLGGAALITATDSTGGAEGTRCLMEGYLTFDDAPGAAVEGRGVCTAIWSDTVAVVGMAPLAAGAVPTFATNGALVVDVTAESSATGDSSGRIVLEQLFVHIL